MPKMRKTKMRGSPSKNRNIVVERQITLSLDSRGRMLGRKKTVAVEEYQPRTPYAEPVASRDSSLDKEGDVAIESEDQWVDEIGPGEDAFVRTAPRIRIRSRAGDHPMQDWYPLQQHCLDKMLEHDAFPHDTTLCPECNIALPSVRCLDCSGLEVLCSTCCVSGHRRQPLHRVQRWNGSYFERSSLYELGLSVHLGHRGSPCPYPILHSSHFTVVHSNGVHDVRLFRCGCPSAEYFPDQLFSFAWFPATPKQPASAITFQSLKHFQNLTLQCKSLSAYDYCQTLQRELSNVNLTEAAKNRYRQFLRVSRLFRHLKVAKRAGRGHDPDGIIATKPGDCIVECPACPHPNKNLPEDWAAVSPSWLHKRMVCLDANFRLKRYGKVNEEVDPPLGDGWGYIVQSQPYETWLAKFQGQKEMSTCTGLKAVDLANARNQKGYATSGVGACDCARHGMKLAAGDLQKGEKYCNMDFIFLTALRNNQLPQLLISYDINCQWSVRLPTRIAEAPEQLRLGIEGVEFCLAIPNLHLYGHKEECIDFSLHYLTGVGQTCGEIIESGWAISNPIAGATASMGAGARLDTLNDHWGDTNWRKTVGMAEFLVRKLKEALKEYLVQSSLYNAFSASLDPEQIRAWSTMIHDWNQDRTKPNPYKQPTGHALTLAQVRNQLAEEEGNIEPGRVIPHGVSSGVWLTTGFDLEELRFRLSKDKGRLADATANQQADYRERLNLVGRKFASWQDIQAVYMPGLSGYLQTQVEGDLQENGLPRMWLPSAIPNSLRADICSADLATKEFRLRQAQAEQALTDIRNQLRVSSHLLKYKRDNARGQRSNTRSRSLISTVDDKIALCAARYRRARLAMLSLQRGDWEQRLKLLAAEDIRFVSESVAEATGQVAFRDWSRPQGMERQASRTVSWIWLVGDGHEHEGSEYMNSVLRVEWARAQARKLRWEEQILLVREEIRRVPAFFRWKSLWWQERADLRQGIPVLTRAGLFAYASRQSALFADMAAHAERTCREVLVSSADAITDVIQEIVDLDSSEAGDGDGDGDGAHPATDSEGDEGGAIAGDLSGDSEGDVRGGELGDFLPYVDFEGDEGDAELEDLLPGTDFDFDSD